VTSTEQVSTTTITYSSPTAEFLARVKSKIDSTNHPTESPITSILHDEISAHIESILTTTIAPTMLSFSSSTLKTTASSNATILAIILVCSFSGFLFLVLIFTFLLR